MALANLISCIFFDICGTHLVLVILMRVGKTIMLLVVTDFERVDERVYEDRVLKLFDSVI